MPIHATTTDRVTTITIDRPERRNALDLPHLEALDAAVSAAVDGGTRAVVLTGSDGHFCAGADLHELEDVSFTRRLAEALAHLAAVPVVTVAAVEGSCMGLGMQLALASDLRVVADDARLAVPVSRLGLMVDHWTLERLRRLLGEGAARHLVLAGAVLTADDAWRLGFAQVRGGLEEARALAAQAVPLAPLTQAGSKAALAHVPGDEDSRAAYDEAFERAWASEDLHEGRAAFRERRPPEFRGR